MIHITTASGDKIARGRKTSAFTRTEILFDKTSPFIGFYGTTGNLIDSIGCLTQNTTTCPLPPLVTNQTAINVTIDVTDQLGLSMSAKVGIGIGIALVLLCCLCSCIACICITSIKLTKSSKPVYPVVNDEVEIA